MADGNEANQGEKDEVAVLGIDFGIRVASIEDKAFVGNSVHGQKGVAGVNQCGSSPSKEGGRGALPKSPLAPSGNSYRDLRSTEFITLLRHDQ